MHYEALTCVVPWLQLKSWSGMYQFTIARV